MIKNRARGLTCILAVMVTILGILTFKPLIAEASFTNPQAIETVYPLQYSAAIAHGNGVYVVTQLEGEIDTSTDLKTWTKRYDGGSYQDFDCVTYGNNKFVTVGSNGTILTSPDGINWTTQTSGTSNTLGDVSYINGEFIATSYSGDILESTDGSNWVSVTSGVNTYLTTPTYLNGQYLIPGYGFVVTSADGITWTKETSGIDQYAFLSNIAFIKGNYVATGGEGYGGCAYISADGVNWTNTNANIEADCRTMVNTGSELIAGGGYGFFFKSPDGINWTEAFECGGDTNDSIYENGTVIFVSTVGILTSTDLSTYKIMGGEEVDVTGIAYGNGEYVMTDGASYSHRVVVSTDAKNWNVVQLPAQYATSTYDIIFHNGMFIVTGDDGYIWTSSDGLNWTLQSTDTTSTLYSIIYANSEFIVAGGFDGAILTSPDGITWKTVYSTTLSNSYFGGIAYGSNGLVAFEKDYEKLFKSTNGTTWTNVSSPISSPSCIAYGHGEYVLFGNNHNYCEVSSDGINWSEETVGAQNIHGVIYDGREFIAYGGGSIISSTDGISWTAIADSLDYDMSGKAVINNGTMYIPTGADKLMTLESIASGLEAPTGLAASNLTYNSVDLTWNVTTGATGYNIYKDGMNVGSTIGNDTTNFTAPGLIPGNTYSFTVTSTSAGNESDYSEPVSVTIERAPQLPAPTGLVANNLTQNSADLTWNLVAGATGYNIYKDGTKIESDIGSDTNTFTATGLTIGATYSFEVTDTSNGTESDYSNSVSVTISSDAQATTPQLNVPQNLRSSDKQSNYFVLNWDTVSGVQQYYVYKDGFMLNYVSGTSVGIDGLQPNTQYSFTVASAVGQQVSDQSMVLNVTLDSSGSAYDIPVPQNLKSSDLHSNYFKLSWDDIPGISWYDIYQDGAWIAGSPCNSMGLAGLTPDYEHYYTVEACDANNIDGAPSAKLIVTLNSGDTELRSGAPQNLRADNLGPNSCTLHWDTVTEADAYCIYQDGNWAQIIYGQASSIDMPYLTGDSTTQFYVTAINDPFGSGSVESAPSNTVTVTLSKQSSPTQIGGNDTSNSTDDMLNNAKANAILTDGTSYYDPITNTKKNLSDIPDLVIIKNPGDFANITSTTKRVIVQQ